jgi:hypothetical protein
MDERLLVKLLEAGGNLAVLIFLVWRLDARMAEMRVLFERLAERLQVLLMQQGAQRKE